MINRFITKSNYIKLKLPRSERVRNWDCDWIEETDEEAKVEVGTVSCAWFELVCLMIGIWVLLGEYEAGKEEKDDFRGWFSVEFALCRIAIVLGVVLALCSSLLSSFMFNLFSGGNVDSW